MSYYQVLCQAAGKIEKAFGNDSLSRAQVFLWHKDSANGRETVQDERDLDAPPLLDEHKRRQCEGSHSSRSMFDN
jgi:hypothetical protein